MSVQVKRRRDTAANLATFTGAQGELLVDTTNNRLQVHDGATAGGWPAALETRTAVSDAAYSALVTDRLIAYTALTAARVVTLPAASSYPSGARLTIVDESGACSSTKTITVARAGSDAIAGATSLVLSAAYAALEIESNGSNAWAVLTARAPSTARTAVSDAAYSVLTTDRLVAYTALTAARTVSLPAASAYPTGVILWIVDESGACSASKTITINRASSDTIDGATSAALNGAYQAVALESNGSNGWTTVVSGPNDEFALLGVGTAPDPNNPLSVYGASALFNGTNFNFTINKAASGDTASVIFEDGFSGRAQMGLNGSDNFSFKVSANGSAWTTAIALDATTGVATLANQRTAVSDAAYSALVTDRLIAYTALTAARVVSLPAASAYPPGQALTIADESGACSAAKTISVARAGSDTIDGVTYAATLASPYASIALESNGSNEWTVIGRTLNVQLFSSSGTYYPQPGMTVCDVYALGGAGGGGSGCIETASVACSGGGASLAFGRFTAAQVGASQTVTIGAGGVAVSGPSGSSATAGTNGNVGNATTFGSLLEGRPGGGGAGGQLSATVSGGGGGAGVVAGGGSSTGATAGTGGQMGGGAGGSASNASSPTFPYCGAGGAGGQASGAVLNGATGVGGGAGGGSGAGLTSSSGTTTGGIGGGQYASGAVLSGGSGAGGAANTSGSGGGNVSTPMGYFMAGGGGGGGGSGATTTTGGSGGTGGYGSGGGGGGSVVAGAGSQAGGGGAGGQGYMCIVEHF